MKAALLITIITSLLGKALGFMRLQQIAATLGVSMYSDSLLIALQIVWLVEVVLISSAVSPMIISRLYQIDAFEGAEAAVTFFLHAALTCLSFSIAYTVLVLLFVDQLIWVIAPGLKGDATEILANFLLISAITPTLMVLAHFLALLNRILQNGAWYSIPQIVTNSAAISGLIIGYNLIDARTGAYWMMASLAFGVFIVCLIQLWAIPSPTRALLFCGIRRNFAQALQFDGKWSFWSGVGALAFVALVNEAFIYIDFYFASNLEEGSISMLGFASRLATLTTTLIVGSAFVVLEPKWAKELALSGSSAWKNLVLPDILSLIAVLSIPVAVLFTFPAAVTDLIYSSHEYTPLAEKKIILLTQIFSLGIIAMALDLITARAVVIANKQRSLLWVSLLLIPIKIGLNLLFVEYFGLFGLAMATVSVVFLQVIGNSIILLRAKVPLGLQMRDIFAIAAVFLIEVTTAQTILAIIPNGKFAVLLSCLILPFVLLAMGKAFGLSFARIVFKRFGRI